MIIVIDIETIPGESDFATHELAKAIEDVHAPKNYKTKEAIEKWHDTIGNDKRDELHHKQCFDATTGEIITAGIKVNDDPATAISRFHGSEADILQDFFDLIDGRKREIRTQPMFVGHNHIKFDLPYIWRRSKILGVQVPAYFPVPMTLKPWSTNVFDTMVAWAGTQGSISMDKLARVLGIPGKGEMDGSMVWQYYLDGRQAEIDAYCIDDVTTTSMIAERLM